MDILSHHFYRKASGKNVKTTQDRADTARIPIDDYQEFLNMYNQQNSDDMISIPKTEYNGLQKCLRIVKDRALQQVEKSKVDEHGYCPKSVKRRKYSQEIAKEALYVTYITPHSIKIPYDDAIDLIKFDLEKFYNYIDIPQIKDDKGIKHQITKAQFFKIVDQLQDPEWQKRDFLLTNSPFGRRIKEWFSGKITDGVAFDFAELTANYAKGVYEASFWAIEFKTKKQDE